VSDPLQVAVSQSLQMIPPGSSLLLAVSGGVDSLTLLQLLYELAPTRQLRLVVGHFDHAQREQSHQDACWVAAHCTALGVPCIIERSAGPVTATAREEWARQARYDFLERAARQAACQWLVTGHTRDDQVETVLHHLVRGTGLAGLRGMPPERALSSGLRLWRPLLAVSRAELQQWLARRAMSGLQDPTNADQSLTRNRIRHRLLPQLREEFNPQVDAAVLRLARQAAEMEESLRWAMTQLFPAGLGTLHQDEVGGISWTFRCELVREVPPAIVIGLLKSRWQELHWPLQKMTADHWYRLLELTRHSGHPTGIDLPGGISARWRRGVISLQRVLNPLSAMETDPDS
jgi:tRNA(Ile)-lysidine synthase